MFLKIVGSLLFSFFAIVGFVFLLVADTNNDDDTIIIEYKCSDVLLGIHEYPPQAVRECRALRGIETKEKTSL
jgi:hypothetical protein